MNQLSAFRVLNARVLGRTLAAWLAGAAIVVSLPTAANNGQYCDELVPDVDCVDPALEPGSQLDMGTISPDNTVAAIKPGEPLDIADDGQFDGIYQCNITPQNSAKSQQSYISINGHASGEAIFVLAGIDPNSDPYAGYGKGKFSGNTLTGTTNVGGVFTGQFAMGGDANGNAQATIDGKVHAKGRDSALKPVEYDVAVKCVSIW